MIKMIFDLIEFGKWLNDNNQDDFGKNVKENDYVLCLSFDNNTKLFSFKEIVQIKDFDSSYHAESVFSEQYYITTDQKIMIPSKSNLMGLTPFFIKIDHDFKTKGGIHEENVPKFFKKIERSKKANNDGKEFNKIIETVYSDKETYLSNIVITADQMSSFESFFSEYSLKYVKNRINEYYEFLSENQTQIVDMINKFKESNDYDKKSRGNFYLSCYFDSHFDLINDVFYYYSKFIKERSDDFDEHDNEICAFCGNNRIVYPSIGSYSLGIPSYSFNYDKNGKTVIKNSRLRFCKKCSTYVMLAEDKLKKILMNNILIIPKKINGDYKDFLMISNKEINTFQKINEFMNTIDGFNYDLAIYTLERGDRHDFKKYIENYRAFRVKFDGISLYQGDILKYLFNEHLKIGEKRKSEIKNMFDIESIFKEFFVDIEDEKINPPKFRHFYQIYTKDITGKTGIFFKFDTKTVTIFTKYMHNIFNLIYELNEDALNKNILNEIILNSLVKLEKNLEKPRFNILIRLNYYFMLKKELWGDNMLAKENMAKIKGIAKKYNMESKIDKITSEDSNKIVEIIGKDPALKYYLIGQFLGLIDSFKQSEGKKKEVFANFVTNTNRNNIRNLFVTEVLQKNNYYIAKMNKKGKFVFKIFENDLDSLFNEKSMFSFEDYIILIFTGYYTENILSSKYGLVKKKGDENE